MQSLCVLIPVTSDLQRLRLLLGDPTKAHSKLGWKPTTTLEELVKEMIENDREEASKEAYLRREGFNVIGTAQE